MIALDIETSGTDFYRCGIWQIGALEFENPLNTFLEEARIDDEDGILNIPGDKKTVFEVTGKTEKDMRDENKQSQKEMIEHFFKWTENIEIKNCICQNPHFDLGFLTIRANRYGLKIPFHHRAFDLHSIAHTKYFQINGKFLIRDGHSDLGLRNILNFVGLKDERKAHNALEDTRLTAECFSRLVYGKNLLSEFAKFPVPGSLKQ